MAKKVVIFIVEGPSEKKALEAIISEIIISDEIVFEVTYGDVTSNITKVDTNLIIPQLIEIITKTLNMRRFHVNDISEIVLLTDTDGTYIKDDDIKEVETNKVIYEERHIKTSDKNRIVLRNYVKANILNKLSGEKTIKVRETLIPFMIFYMSCNLDHVLYNERNLADNLKNQKAEEFSFSYDGKEKEFITFLEGHMIDKNDNYELSWAKIKLNNNSLLRYSNLWLYLKEYM